MTRRSGVTLIEVLVAIFVMGIGLIALLTLFPLGVLRMYQALRDERCSECAYNADKIGIMFDVRNDPSVISDIPTGVIADFFANPDPTKLPNADPYGESYPVFVDPIGFQASPAGQGKIWVGGFPAVSRRPVSFTGAGGINIPRWFTLWDDISFESNNTNPLIPPATPQRSGTAILRDTRYSWAYLLQRPQTSDRSVVDCSIVVFDQRSMSLTPGALQLEEYLYDRTAYFNPTNGTIAIDYTTAVPPPVRVGDWILDSTINNPATTTPCAAHGYFYRVVSVEEFAVGGKTYARYEVQNPIRGFNDPAKVAMTDATFGYQGTVIVIRGIAEVFEKGPVRLP
jgi:prepilin-type N-terminal cleavage/methylation domain-containing protein